MSLHEIERFAADLESRTRRCEQRPRKVQTEEADGTLLASGSVVRGAQGLSL